MSSSFDSSRRSIYRVKTDDKPQYIVLIDSKDRKSGSSHDYRIDLSEVCGPKDTWTPLSVTMPYTQYTVDQYNNTIYYNEGGTDYSVTIADGTYDDSSLATAVVAALDGGGGSNTYSCSAGATTYKFTIARATGAATFNFTWGSNTLNSASEMLGFSDEDGTAGTTFTGDKVYNLSLPYSIRILVNDKKVLTDNNDNLSTVEVATNVSWGSIIHKVFEPSERTTFGLHGSSMNNIHIRLEDNRGNPVDLQGSNWQLKVRLNAPGNNDQVSMIA